MDILDNILEKPRKYRRKVAYAATGLVGIVIFSAWIVIASSSVKQAISPDHSDQTAKNPDQNQPSLRQENLKTKIVNPDDNQNQQQTQPESQGETFETVLKKQAPDSSNRKIIERP